MESSEHGKDKKEVGIIRLNYLMVFYMITRLVFLNPKALVPPTKNPLTSTAKYFDLNLQPLEVWNESQLLIHLINKYATC